MIRLSWSTGLRLAAWAVFILAFVFPLLALTVAGISGPAPALETVSISSRQWTLLWRSFGLSLGGAAACLVLSLPTAWALVRARGSATRGILHAALLSIALCPPMAYVFGWGQVMPRGISPEIRCIGVWALWACPIPAMLAAAGWMRGGRRAYEAAILSTGPIRACVVGALPALQRYLGLGALILFTLFLGDYGVPHACGLLVYATELLGWASSSAQVTDVIGPAMPGVVAVVALLVLLWTLGRRCAQDETDEVLHMRGGGYWAWLAGVAVMTFALVVPIVGLLLKLPSWASIGETVGTYKSDVGWSLAVAVGAAGIGVAMGIGLVGTAFERRLLMAISLLAGAMPGAVVGAALIAAYNRPGFGWLYSHWPLLVLCGVARFGWVGALAAAVMVRGSAPEVSAAAELDGLNRAGIVARILAPLHWPVIAAAGAIIATLTLAEVAASTLLRTPEFNPLSHVIIEKFHRFEDGALVTLSLGLMFSTLPAAGLLLVIFRRKR